MSDCIGCVMCSLDAELYVVPERWDRAEEEARMADTSRASRALGWYVCEVDVFRLISMVLSDPRNQPVGRGMIIRPVGDFHAQIAQNLARVMFQKDSHAG